MIRYSSAICLFLCLTSLTHKCLRKLIQKTQKEDSLAPNEAVFITSLDELDNNGGDQNTSGLLQSSRDVFASAAGFNFSAARFKIRGYNSDQTAILINGMPINDPESGWGEWFIWGGLNDVTRYSETKNWLTQQSISLWRYWRIFQCQHACNKYSRRFTFVLCHDKPCIQSPIDVHVRNRHAK
jgi:outer membrane receptor for ferrienterochelin and colicin